MQEERLKHEQELLEIQNRAKKYQELRQGREKLLEENTDNFINKLELQAGLLKINQNKYQGVVKKLHDEMIS
jgi:hypothetical protein